MTITPEKLRAAASTGSEWAPVAAADCPILAMAIELADSCARVDIHSECILTTDADDGYWYDLSSVDNGPMYDDLCRSVAYLAARGLLELHPERKELVRLVDQCNYAQGKQECVISEEALDSRTVTIPGRTAHDGYYSVAVKLRWKCPQCGGNRGEIYEARSYDGSLILAVDAWHNPCGHVDKYSAMREEASRNGLNQGVG